MAAFGSVRTRVARVHTSSKKVEEIIGGVSAIASGFVAFVGGIVLVMDALKPQEAKDTSEADQD
jgi:hypothetical protein